MSTYTDHKLTDAMLQHLSATLNGRQVGGISMQALKARGLIARYAGTDGVTIWLATPLGNQALADARAQGW